jgi:hypothetical protein
VRVNNFIKGSLLVLAPLAFFWGCAKGNAPVGPASASVASITVPLKDSHGKDLSATQVSVLYYIAGTGAPLKGNAGTASASTGNSFSFNVKLPTGNSYSYVAVQINDSANNLIAAGAATLSGGTVPVTLGPVNKPVYQITLGAGKAFNFESYTTSTAGANTAPGMDAICKISSDGTGFELDDSALANDTIAYLGNGNFVNYLQLPSTFAESSSSSKSQFATGPSSMAPGDVYCVKLSGGGHAWLQVVSVGAAGPVFVYRVNTSLPYCGYEQTTADLASSVVSNPTVTPTVGSDAVTVAGSVSILGSLPYDVAIFGPTNGAATTMFVPNSATGTIGVYSVANPLIPTLLSTITGLTTPVGLAVDTNGHYLYVASSGVSMVNQYQITNLNVPGSVGGGAEVSGLSDTQAASGALDRPRYVAVDNNGDLFITDTGTDNVSDVMEFLSPVPLTAATNVNYWNGSLNSLGSGGVSSIGQITTAGTTIIVANSANNSIDLYSASETAGFVGAPISSITSDNNTSGPPVSFVKPQGVAYSIATNDLYISDTGNNRIIEMTLSGNLVKILSGLGLNGPTGIKVDNNTIPPNIYVADTGNSQIVILQ